LSHIIDHMTVHEYTFAEAAEIVNCSPSTLRRKLNKNGSALGATKLARGWSIPVTTLEALGLIDIVNVSDDRSTSVKMTQDDRLELERLRERTRQQEQLIASLRLQIADQRAAMKLIEARSDPQPRPEPSTSLWHRIFG
jgi:hypothetical protein